MGKLTKVQRSSLREKFGGRCAYCGAILGRNWHADHFAPVIRDEYRGGYINPENDRLDNYMPSCPPCNISKSRMTIDDWRDWLLGHVVSLGAHSTPYRLARAYGLIVETGNPVVFYFEKCPPKPKL